MIVVGLSNFAKYAQILKNSVASKETAGQWIFLIGSAVVEEEAGSGAQVVD